MSFIHLNNEQLPGISGLLQTYQNTGTPLCQLAESLLQCETEYFSKLERELLASYVSYLNKCIFCSFSHGEVANYYASADNLAQSIWANPDSDLIDDKMKLLLSIGAKIQTDPKGVSGADINKCREFNMSDNEINEVALIASAFCMYNRYVDSLGTEYPPANSPAYKEMGKMLAVNGYNRER